MEEQSHHRVTFIHNVKLFQADNIVSSMNIWKQVMVIFDGAFGA